jgi:hypothetical protein
VNIVFQAERIINGLRQRIIGESHVTAYYGIMGRFAHQEMLFLPAARITPGT